MHERVEKRTETRGGIPVGENLATLRDIWSVILLRRRVILLPIAVAFAAAAAYMHYTVPTFTARAQVIIDSRMPQFIPGRAVDTVLAWDTAQVESEIAVLQSERIASRVVMRLGLGKDGTFRTAPSLSSRLMRRITGLFLAEGGPQEDGFRAALGTIANGLNIRRTGLSYAIDITFSFPDPLRAQQIANATADAYIADQLENRAEAARIGGEWLQQRMMLLRSQMNVASRAVQVFRASHDYSIASSGPNAGAPALSNGNKTLDELESDAATYRRIYESFLQSYTESVQRQSFPVSDAHVLTEASLPLVKSAPKSLLVCALAGLVGSLLGLGLAAVIHNLDRTVRSSSQIVEATGLDDLGTMTLPRMRPTWAWCRKLWRAFCRKRRAAFGEGTSPQDEDPGRAWHGADTPYLSAVLEHRNQAFGRDVTALKVFLDLVQVGGRPGCIGITSSRRDAGSSVLAGNLAVLYAKEGWKTLLIDADLQRQSLSNSLEAKDKPGLLQVINGESSLNRAALTLGRLPLDFLPASEANCAVQRDHVLMSRAMAALIQKATETYEVVIIDLPPALPVGGALALSPHLTGLILAVRAGASTMDSVVAAFNGIVRAQARVFGFVLTDTPGRRQLGRRSGWR